jgi:hypothetical protein
MGALTCFLSGKFFNTFIQYLGRRTTAFSVSSIQALAVADREGVFGQLLIVEETDMGRFRSWCLG